MNRFNTLHPRREHNKHLIFQHHPEGLARRMTSGWCGIERVVVDNGYRVQRANNIEKLLPFMTSLAVTSTHESTNMPFKYIQRVIILVQREFPDDGPTPPFFILTIKCITAASIAKSIPVVLVPESLDQVPDWKSRLG